MSAEPKHYDGTPGPTKGKTLATWQEFEGEIKTRERELGSMLPSNVSRERFINSTIAAVKQTPDLLTASPRSLLAAVVKSAQDGLLPDGREGVILAFYDKNKGEKVAQWLPMAHGLRKRARELDDIIVDAQVVYENDKFVWRQGDDPGLDHLPAQLGTPRGVMIGAYAIFRKGADILHREVMDAGQIETARQQSKAPDSLMWKKFPEEGYRKTVIRRGVKTVPVSEPLEQIVRRDDEMFDLATPEKLALVPPPAPIVALTPPPSPIPGPVLRTPDPGQLTEDEERALDRRTMAEMHGGPAMIDAAEPEEEPTPAPRDGLAEWVSDKVKESLTMKTQSELDLLDDMVVLEVDSARREDLRTVWNAAYGARKAAFKAKK